MGGARGPRLVSETNPVPFVLSTVVDVPVSMVVEGAAGYCCNNAYKD